MPEDCGGGGGARFVSLEEDRRKKLSSDLRPFAASSRMAASSSLSSAGATKTATGGIAVDEAMSCVRCWDSPHDERALHAAHPRNATMPETHSLSRQGRSLLQL
jgi:hypothetical protein